MGRKFIFRHNRTANTNICAANNNRPQTSQPRRHKLTESLLSNENRAEKSARLKCDILVNYRTRSSGTRTAAEAESRPKEGCCNRRLSGLVGDVAKISFQTPSHCKHEYLRSKQQPTIDKSAEAPHADRAPLSNENRAEKSARLSADKGTRTPTPLGIRS